MRAIYHTGLTLILLIVNSCSFLSNSEKSVKKKDYEKIETENSIECPSYYIPNYTRFLKNKKNEKQLKLHSVKLQCKLEKNKKNSLYEKVIITQIIYYQILKNNVKIDSSKAKVFISLVDEDNNIKKFKVLTKIRITPTIKVKDKVF